MPDQTNHLSLSGTVTHEIDVMIQRVQRSLVVVRSGRQGAGAGIVWRGNGVILTNNHVIARGRTKVILMDGRELPAETLDRAPEIDLALLRIEENGLPAALVADARHLRVGELVIAIGHPWGQRNSVTMGVISGLGEAQTHGPRKTVPIIRSDVRLAPGNSGGPLLNASGGVVGINTMIVGGDQGVAVPSHVATTFVTGALDRQVVLGVGVQVTPLPEVAIAQVGLDQQTGLLVLEVTPKGPAERAGVLPGDILVELSGLALEEPRALLHALAPRDPGERVPLGILRAGRWKTVEAELAPMETVM